MKELIVSEVQEGNMLRLHVGNSPIGQPITVPPGVTSVTIIVRDTAEFEAGKARLAERRARRQGRLAAARAGRPGRQRRRPKE